MKRVALSAMALLVTATLANAQPPRGDGPGGFRPPNPLLMIFDADQDGTLSKDEIAKAAEALAKLDKDGNGSIEESELPRAPRPQFGGGRGGFGGPGGAGGERPSLADRMKEMDKNGDGAITKDELSDRIPEQFRDRMFEGMDTDKDGKITKEEMEAATERFRQRAAEGGFRRPGGGSRPDGEGGRRPRRPAGENPDA